MKRGPIIALAGLLAAGAAGFYWYRTGEAGPSSGYQGYIEGNLVYLAPEQGGRIDKLNVDVGDAISRGKLVFVLDSKMETAQRDEALAKLKQAQATLENLKMAQQRPEQIAVLKAQQDRARANLELSKRELERQRDLYQRGIAAKATFDQAQAAFDRDTASLAEATRQIDAGLLTGRRFEVGAAEAAVVAQKAALEQAETRLAKRQVVASADGRIQDVFFRPGEVVNAGQPVLALLPPGNLRFRFYVPEPALSAFTLGQAVTVSCDGCPAGIAAKISFISRQAEFTPPVIFSDRERAKLVFRVEAQPNEVTSLPLGLPVGVHPVASASAQR